MPRFQRAVRWLLLLALTVPLAVGVSVATRVLAL